MSGRRIFSEFLLGISKSRSFGTHASGRGRQVGNTRERSEEREMFGLMGAGLNALDVADVDFRPVPIQVADARIAVRRRGRLGDADPAGVASG
jgi:hypothetical protein